MASSSSVSVVPAPLPQPDACRLLNLPEELFFRVLQACTISSILKIRQCCTIAWHYTKDRSVWIHQLSSFLALMKIGHHTVVPDIDSLATTDLELLVSRHLRSRYRARRCQSGSLACAKWRVSGSEGIQSILMLRGGRLLVGCSRDTLFCWDIGFQIGRPAESTVLVCSVTIDLPPGCTSDSTCIWHHRYVDRMVYVSIWTSGNWGHRAYVCTYKLNLTSTQREFHSVSRLLLPEGFNAGSLHSEKLTLYRESPPALGVHYYDPPTTITWDSKPPAYFSIPGSMPNFAIVEYTDADTDVDEASTKLPTVTIWELPTASRFGTQPTQHLTDYKPFRTWHMPAEFPGDLISVISWEKGLQEGTYFNRFKSGEETVTVLRHSVVPKYSEFADLMEPEIHNDPTIDLPRSTFGGIQENDLIELCTFPDGMRVLYWPAGAKLFMHFSHANDEFPPFHVIVGSQHPAFQQWYTHSIMVSVGRICVLDEGEVEIWELC